MSCPVCGALGARVGETCGGCGNLVLASGELERAARGLIALRGAGGHATIDDWEAAWKALEASVGHDVREDVAAGARAQERTEAPQGRCSEDGGEADPRAHGAAEVCGRCWTAERLRGEFFAKKAVDLASGLQEALDLVRTLGAWFAEQDGRAPRLQALVDSVRDARPS